MRNKLQRKRICIYVVLISGAFTLAILVPYTEQKKKLNGIMDYTRMLIVQCRKIKWNDI
jgi:hypothetical protein